MWPLQGMERGVEALMWHLRFILSGFSFLSMSLLYAMLFSALVPLLIWGAAMIFWGRPKPQAQEHEETAIGASTLDSDSMEELRQSMNEGTRR